MAPDAQQISNVVEIAEPETVRMPWFGVVGLEIPEGVDLHPATEDVVFEQVCEGGMALLVDRNDGHFGFVWGFDSTSSRAAERHVRRKARSISSLIGATAIVEQTVRYNKRLAGESDAAVIIHPAWT